jgi:glycosyltransferase involved in cell wall biosynthesis
MGPEPRPDHRTGTAFLSVVMPVHEGSEFIGATLESLAAPPNDDLDVIVVDSSPTSKTADIVEQFASRIPLRLLRREDMKPWQTKTNLGVELATAEHVCILHQDDLWLSPRLEAVRRWISQFPDAPLHLAPTAMIDRNGQHMGQWNCPLPAEKRLSADFILSRLLVQNFVSVPAPIFRRSAWLDCGGMDESLWYTPDWDIWIKLAAQGPVVHHKDVTTAFRIHGGSLTVTGSRNANEFRAQMETVLDRHLHRLPAGSRHRVERAARASIGVNVSLAAASGGSLPAIFRTLRDMVFLGPAELLRYLRYSRLHERVLPRLRARLRGAF